jgi:hypothetical protein
MASSPGPSEMTVRAAKQCPIREGRYRDKRHRDISSGLLEGYWHRGKELCACGVLKGCARLR